MQFSRCYLLTIIVMLMCSSTSCFWRVKVTKPKKLLRASYSLHNASVDGTTYTGTSILISNHNECIGGVVVVFCYSSDCRPQVFFKNNRVYLVGNKNTTDIGVGTIVTVSDDCQPEIIEEDVAFPANLQSAMSLTDKIFSEVITERCSGPN